MFVISAHYKTRQLIIKFRQLCSRAGRYDSSIPTWFLASIDCLKILTLVLQCSTDSTEKFEKSVKKDSSVIYVLFPPSRPSQGDDLGSIFLVLVKKLRDWLKFMWIGVFSM